MTSVTIYDGARTIGGSKIYLEEENNGMFLDFGMNFKKYGEYFQEFLNARGTRGIHDYFTLDLIPKLNIYRRDLIPGDISISQYPSLNIQGVLLSHAHLDHFGNISLLRRDIPIVASSTSIALMKAILDTSRGNLSNEAAFFSEKVPKQNEDRVLVSNGEEYVGRQFFSTSHISDDLRYFMESCTRSGRGIQSKELSSLAELRLPFHITPYPVDHSILGANAYLIEGDTTIAYTGDFRLHGRRGAQSKEFIKNATNASVLITEGTRVSREDDSVTSEETVYENCLSTIETAKNLVVVNFSNRNIERFQTFKRIAEQTGRRLVVPAKIGYLLKTLECVDGKNYSTNVSLLKNLKRRQRIWERCLTKPEGNKENGRLSNLFAGYFTCVDPLDIGRSPEQFILCMSFYDLKYLLDIKPDTGMYIHSSSEAFTEESEFDFVRFYHWLDRFGFQVHGMSMKAVNGTETPMFTEGYHSSGHVNKDGLRWAIDTIDPDLIIPVHTEEPEWFQREFDDVVLPVEGKKLEF
ncbi:MAG: ribonuclease J [Promethearchaeia archaeon]